ncbi:MAG: putative transport protein [Acetobacteraceae bacterium]|jgi:putative transport protein|nr:putative transport protein [Acetobacteraceae bacterium]
MWFYNLFFSGAGTANAVMVIALVACIGLAFGEIKFGPVHLGIAGPLFIGLALGHFGFKMNMDILGFARDFGLVLFVYAIGIRVGPGFFSAFKRDGALLNMFAASIVILGALTAVAIHFVVGLPLEVITGLFAGATTNTPSLAAGQQMLVSLQAAPQQVASTGLAYAVAYPFGIIGILLTMGLIRMIFGVLVPREAENYSTARISNRQPSERMSIEIRSQAVEGVALPQVPGLRDVAMGVIVSRVMHDGSQHVAVPSDVFHIGDVLLCNGPRAQLEKLRDLLGIEAAVKLHEINSPVTSRDMLVTQTKIVGRHIADLHIRDLYGVTITRLNRAGIDLTPLPSAKLQFGDYLSCVGEEARLKQVESIIGNQASALNHTQIIPIFLAIALGVLLGSIPIFIPGVPAPLALGLAGGPVVVAIILARIGSIGPLRWNMPPDTIDTIREVGVSLFMACVGIYAGKSFVATVMNGDGLLWMACAAVITFVPIFVVGLIARGIFKVNYLTLCGVLAGSMTDPPALAFANGINPSQAQSVAYAAVYPLTMCLRILSPQIILGVLWLTR